MTPPDGRDVAEAAVDLEGRAVAELRRVTDLLATWTADHANECTAEIDAAIYCAHEVLHAARTPPPTPATAGEPSTAEERVTRAAEALSNFAWSAVTVDTSEATVYLQQLLNDLRLALRTAPASSLEGGEIERLRRAVETFMSAYRARYGTWTRGIRSNAPMRDEARELNAVFAALAPHQPEGGDNGRG